MMSFLSKVLVSMLKNFFLFVTDVVETKLEQKSLTEWEGSVQLTS
jgi:hypothetical protein